MRWPPWASEDSRDRSLRVSLPCGIQGTADRQDNPELLAIRDQRRQRHPRHRHCQWRRQPAASLLLDTQPVDSPPFAELLARFAEKMADVVGLYLDPPAHAVVLSIDEKSQIQALDRTQPGLPLKPGRCGTMTHDYKRHGTTTLFAALNVPEGTVIGRCMQRHRHEDFIRFLNTVERAVPAGRIIEAVVDNYATHKHPKVKPWLARHPRWMFHFTPTSGSWLNAVETFFSALTRQGIRRGSFHSIVSLQAAINCYLDERNA